MKKKLFVIILSVIMLFTLVALTACNDTPEEDNNTPYTYQPSDDFFNLITSLTGNGATTRAFSVMTPNEEIYANDCVLQLDPAGADETKPQFNTDDNIVLETINQMNYELFDTPTIDWELSKNAFDNAKNTTLKDRMSHQAFAEDLVPGQKYFYRMGYQDTDKWSNWGTFTTDDGDDTFTFFHITDSQASNQEQFDIFGNSIDMAFEHAGTPEFVLFTGDLVNNGYYMEEWDMLFNSMSNVSNTTSFSPSCGNHEKFAYFLAYHFNTPMQLFYTYYAYEYGDALVMVLDTEDDILIHAQAEWAESVLAQSDKKWKFVSFHKSFYSSGGHADGDDTLRLRDVYAPMFAKYGVDLVMSGHDHVYARTAPVDIDGNRATPEDYSSETIENGVVKEVYTNPNGVIYSINRTIGTKYYAGEGHNANVISVGDEGRMSTPVFSKIDVEGDTLIYTAYEIHQDTNEITIIDTFEIHKLLD